MAFAIIQINGEPTRYVARESKDKPCKGCLFEPYRSEVCNRAAYEASLVDQPDCDDKAKSGASYIYVLDESDPRQMDLLEEVKNEAN